MIELLPNIGRGKVKIMMMLKAIVDYDRRRENPIAQAPYEHLLFKRCMAYLTGDYG